MENKKKIGLATPLQKYSIFNTTRKGLDKLLSSSTNATIYNGSNASRENVKLETNK